MTAITGDLAGFLRRGTRLVPNSRAVVCPDWDITYAELGARVARIAALLPPPDPTRGPEPIAVIGNCR